MMEYLFKFDWTVFLSLLTVAVATELVPERFLRPRDFNHHPFTDVGVPASIKSTSGSLPDRHPYAILSRKKPREGRQFPHQDVVLYPNPHPSVLPKKHLETNEINYDDDPYTNVPKNYAFSYSVKDIHSGDDFSHSQAHNGKATRGQYRVKLPDGRVQVVSYTADHKGYRADVTYEEESKVSPVAAYPSPVGGRIVLPNQNIPETPTALPEHKPNTLQTLQHYVRHRLVQPDRFPEPEQQTQQQQVYVQPQYVYVTTQRPDTEGAQPSYKFIPVYAKGQLEFGSRTTLRPAPYASTPGPERFSLGRGVVSTLAPHLVQTNDKYLESKLQQKYVVTVAPQQHYLSTTTPQHYLSTTTAPQHYISTSTPQPDYSDDNYLSSSPQVIVTPRSPFKQATSRIIYRYVQEKPR